MISCELTGLIIAADGYDYYLEVPPTTKAVTPLSPCGLSDVLADTSLLGPDDLIQPPLSLPIVLMAPLVAFCVEAAVCFVALGVLQATGLLNLADMPHSYEAFGLYGMMALAIGYVLYGAGPVHRRCHSR